MFDVSVTSSTLCCCNDLSSVFRWLFWFFASPIQHGKNLLNIKNTQKDFVKEILVDHKLTQDNIHACGFQPL